VEHAHPIDRTFSWRGITLTRPALLMLIGLVAVGAWALVHRVVTPAVAQSRQAPLRPRYATSVLVLNGNGVAGAAVRVAARLLAGGYRETPATNAPVTTYARSIVVYRRGWEHEAERLAKDAHVRAVAPLDGALPAGHSRFPLVLILGH
jgi:hypothetical protein